MYRIGTTVAPDFSVLWLIARDFGKTVNPYLNSNVYTPSGYPPFTYLFYIPLTLFSFNIAQFTFLGISFVSILGSVWLSLKLIFKKFDPYLFLFVSALALTAFPTKFTFGMGQINAVVLLLLLLSYYESLKSKSIASGTALGFAIMLKPVFGFFLLFFVIGKKWRLIYYAFLTVFAGFLITYVFYDLGIWEYWIKNIIVPLLNYSGREVYYNQGFLGFISRLTGDLSVRKIAEWAAVLVSIVPIYLFGKTKNSLLYLSLFITTLLIADSLSWQHHFIWLIFPFVLLIKYAINLKKVWFWILLLLAYLCVGWNFKNPDGLSPLILSNTFYGGLILWGLNIYILKLQQRPVKS